MRISTVAAWLVLPLGSMSVSPAGLFAQGPAWSFSAQSARALSLPDGMATDSLRKALSYPGGPSPPIAGFRADLDRDGTPDFVLRSSLDVCGSNCEYLLIDGLSGMVLGRVGGSALFVGPAVVNGYPVIRQYGHSSADAGYWSTLVFDGETYVGVDVVYVEGESAARLFESLSDVPAWPSTESGSR